MTPIGIAIVGCGYYAGVHAEHLTALREGARLFFVSREKSRAEEFALRFRADGAFGSLAEALRDERVSAVILTTPHDLHCPQALEAIEADRDVLVEKPIALSLDEADRMILAARRRGKILMVAENYRFSAPIVRAKSLLDSGRLGRLRYVRASLELNRTYRPLEWRGSREQMGGGALIDGGIHLIDVLLNFGGKVRSVTAYVPPNADTSMEGEDTVFVLVRFDSGAVGSLHFSWQTRGSPRGPDILVAGTASTAHIPLNGIWMRVVGDHRERHFMGFNRFFRRDRGGRTGVLREFLRAKREGREASMSAEEGRRDLECVLAAYRSIEAGGAVLL